MKLSYSKLMGMYVVSEQAQQPVSIITGVHIDPETGHVLALECAFKKVLCPIDIIDIGQVVHVNDESSLSDFEDILRLKNLPEKGDQLMYKEVRDEDNLCIGNVSDFMIDTSTMSLHQIVVKKSFFFITQATYTIPRKHIIKIESTTVYVKNMQKEVKVAAPVMEVA